MEMHPAAAFDIEYKSLVDVHKKRFLTFRNLRAIDGARTRGLDLGKVARYQLRHYRIFLSLVPYDRMYDII